MYNVRLGFCQEILRTNKNTAGTRMDSCPVLVRSTETEETELWDFLHPRPKIGARRCYWSVACNMIELLVSHPTCYSFFSRDLKLFLRFFHPTFGTWVSLIFTHQLFGSSRVVKWLSEMCRWAAMLEKQRQRLKIGIRLGTPWGDWTTEKARYLAATKWINGGFEVYLHRVSTSLNWNAKLPDFEPLAVDQPSRMFEQR